MNYQQHFIDTETIRTAYYRSGEGKERKLLVLHGNYSSSVFFMPLMPSLEDRYDVVVPDMRCFGHSEARPIDATRGYRDWSDDVHAFCKAIGWERFILLGWSMGGDVAMQFVTDHPGMAEKLVLVAPGSPYGFGGTKDEEGTPHTPLGLGSGAGTANPMLTFTGMIGDTQFIRNVMYKYLFKEPAQMSPEWEALFVETISSVKVGTDYYPGNYQAAWKWPYVLAGDKGILNTMSPKYGRLDAFLEVEPKPPVLWIRGDDDQVVSDHSMLEFGNLGRIGLIPGWPGEQSYPAQPMVKQTRYFLDRYRDRGGKYIELVIPGGHVCILESPLQFVTALDVFAAM